MCGRYVSTASLAELAEAYAVDEVAAEPLPERYNVAPTQPVYAVATRRARRDEEGGEGKGPTRVLGTFRWGLIPSWAEDASVGTRLINARSETVATAPAFRLALVRRRCVIPADAFWEWRSTGAGPAGGRGGLGASNAGRGRPRRQPYVVRRAGSARLSFAGLWEAWRDPARPDAPLVRSAAIITTAANGVVAPIHDRMPAVLDGPALDVWLDPTVDDPGELRALLVPAPDDGWEAYPVGPAVNSVANEGPALLEPLRG